MKNRAIKILQRLWLDEAGQGMVEYGLIVALISVAVVALLASIGTKLITHFTTIDNELTP